MMLVPTVTCLYTECEEMAGTKAVHLTIKCTTERKESVNDSEGIVDKLSEKKKSKNFLFVRTLNLLFFSVWTANTSVS